MTEWITANSLGGYASSLDNGMNTRKYHGLLISSVNMTRELKVSKLEEFFQCSTDLFSISSNQYPGAVYPEGYKHLKKFKFYFYPEFEYNVNGIKVIKKIIMVKGKNCTLVNYKITCREKCKFIVKLLVNNRGFHELNKKEPRFKQTYYKNKVTINCRGNFYVSCSKEKYSINPLIYRNMVYRQEEKRGYDFTENHFSPGEFVVELEKGSNEIEFCISTEPCSENFSKYSIKEKKRLDKLVFRKNNFLKRLVYASDSFVTRNGIIAGYHWFGQYGRDTFISIPGLLLATKRYGDAKNILGYWSSFCRKGLIPNILDGNNVQYNSIDSSLWFIYAVQKYLEYTQDVDFIKNELYGTLEDIFSEYIKKIDDDGLISFEGDKLTWMDTLKRDGKTVEINALWYNSLRFMSDLCMNLKIDNRIYKKLAEDVKKNFSKVFWNGKYLDDSYGDNSLRPNQIFAVYFDAVDKSKGKRILRLIEKELLTPYGLRSLNTKDNRYQGKYLGNEKQREYAYHNGTVWAWLIGPFVSSYMKVFDNNKKAKRFVSSFKKHLDEYCSGSVSEIFDGDPPHHARGCVSQAWSVAELIRIMKEEI